jgi:hypothetical protein
MPDLAFCSSHILSFFLVTRYHVYLGSMLNTILFHVLAEPALFTFR